MNECYSPILGLHLQVQDVHILQLICFKIDEYHKKSDNFQCMVLVYFNLQLGVHSMKGRSQTTITLRTYPTEWLKYCFNFLDPFTIVLFALSTFIIGNIALHNLFVSVQHFSGVTLMPTNLKFWMLNSTFSKCFWSTIWSGILPSSLCLFPKSTLPNWEVHVAQLSNPCCQTPCRKGNIAKSTSPCGLVCPNELQVADKLKRFQAVQCLNFHWSAKISTQKTQVALYIFSIFFSSTSCFSLQPHLLFYCRFSSFFSSSFSLGDLLSL